MFGRASRAEQLSHRCRSETTMDGVWSLGCNSGAWRGYSLQEEVVVCWFCKWWASMPCDLRSNPMLVPLNAIRLKGSIGKSFWNLTMKFSHILSQIKSSNRHQTNGRRYGEFAQYTLRLTYWQSRSFRAGRKWRKLPRQQLSSSITSRLRKRGHVLVRLIIMSCWWP